MLHMMHAGNVEHTEVVVDHKKVSLMNSWWYKNLNNKKAIVCTRKKAFTYLITETHEQIKSKIYV